VSQGIAGNRHRSRGEVGWPGALKLMFDVNSGSSPVCLLTSEPVAFATHEPYFAGPNTCQQLQRNCAAPANGVLASLHWSCLRVAAVAPPILNQLVLESFLFVTQYRKIGSNWTGSLSNRSYGKIKANVNVCKLRLCLHVGLLASLFGSTMWRSGKSESCSRL
jgi:hypothetical protein